MTMKKEWTKVIWLALEADCSACGEINNVKIRDVSGGVVRCPDWQEPTDDIKRVGVLYSEEWEDGATQLLLTYTRPNKTKEGGG